MRDVGKQLAAGYEMTWGGHRLQRLVANKNEWQCRDCGVNGTAGDFQVGFKGCPGRPDSFRQGFEAADRTLITTQARSEWKIAAVRTTMSTTSGPVSMEWEDVDDTPGVAARFTHSTGRYRLEYGDGRFPESTYVYAVRDDS